MKSKNLFTGLGIIASIIIIWLFIDRKKKKKKIAHLEKASKDLIKSHDEVSLELDSLKRIVEANDEIDDALKAQIFSLVETQHEMDEKISNELRSAMIMLEVNEPNKTVFSLVKIIENLLRRIYADNSEFADFLRNNGRRRPVLADYLEFAKKDGLIKNDEYNIARGLKDIRNKEGHQLGVNYEKNWIFSAILMSICLISKLSNYWKTASQNRND